MRNPESNAANRGQNGNDHVVPYQERVSGDGDEGLSDGVGNSTREQEYRRDDGTHILRRLCEGILETGDGGEDLREGDEDVGDGLDPDVDRSGARAVLA